MGPVVRAVEGRVASRDVGMDASLIKNESHKFEREIEQPDRLCAGWSFVSCLGSLCHGASRRASLRSSPHVERSEARFALSTAHRASRA